MERGAPEVSHRGPETGARLGVVAGPPSAVAAAEYTSERRAGPVRHPLSFASLQAACSSDGTHEASFGSPTSIELPTPTPAAERSEPWLRYSACSCQGRKGYPARGVNQDFVMVHQCIEGLRNVHVFGVLDGHGEWGHAVAEFVGKRVAKELGKELSGERRPAAFNFAHPTRVRRCMETLAPDHLKEMAELFNRVMHRVEEALFSCSEIESSLSGTTLVMMLIVGLHSFTVSVGDSGALLLQRNPQPTAHESLDPGSSAKPAPEAEEVRSSPPSSSRSPSCTSPPSSASVVEPTERSEGKCSGSSTLDAASPVAKPTTLKQSSSEVAPEDAADTPRPRWHARAARPGRVQVHPLTTACTPQTTAGIAGSESASPSRHSVEHSDTPSSALAQVHHSESEGAATPHGLTTACLRPILLTLEHKPTQPQEMARLLRKGAVISPSMLPDGRARGPPRVWKPGTNPMIPGIAMSRSIGDAVATSVGVACDPLVCYHLLDPQAERFLILGSDGLFDVLPQTTVASLAAAATSASDCCAVLSRAADLAWLRAGALSDDVTVLVLEFWPCVERARGVVRE